MATSLSITEHHVLDAYFALNLGQKYKHIKVRHDKLQKTAADVFAFYGVELDLSTQKKREAFLPLILHMGYILDKIGHIRKKSRSRDDIYKGFDKFKPFFKDSNKPDSAANFIKVQEPESR